MSVVLGLDVSTKTGFAVGNIDKDGALSFNKYGLIKLPRPAKTYGVFPWCFVEASRALVKQISETFDSVSPDVVVIENTNLGKSRMSQKMLEWAHLTLLTFLEGKAEIVYLSSSEWRSGLGLQMSKEDKKNNKKLKAAKADAEATGSKLDKASLGVKGKVGYKHLAVRYANDRFGFAFKMKDNDIADAVGLVAAYAAGVRSKDSAED